MERRPVLSMEDLKRLQVTTGIVLSRDSHTLVAAEGNVDLDASDLPGRLKELCGSCGISLVLVPHLPKTYVNGATKWMASDRVLIQLSLRRPYADIIWFKLVPAARCFTERNPQIAGYRKQQAPFPRGSHPNLR